MAAAAATLRATATRQPGAIHSAARTGLRRMRPRALITRRALITPRRRSMVIPPPIMAGPTRAVEATDTATEATITVGTATPRAPTGAAATGTAATGRVRTTAWDLLGSC